MEPIMINTAVKALFEKKAKKANAKAEKLGLKGVDVVYGSTREVACGSDTIGAYLAVDANGRRSYVALYTEVCLIGEAPVVEGYRFVATVDLRGSKPMVRKQPYTNVDLSRFHDTDSHCDHCNTTRARNDVLVMENVATGELMQIGRSCVADFMRSKDATALLACSDWAESYGNITESNGKHEGTVSLQRIYETAAAVVRTFGWVATKDLYVDNTLTSTRSRVWQNLFPWPSMPQEDRVTVTPADVAEAKVVVHWLEDKFLSKEVGACNDFERNVQAAVEGLDGGFYYVRERNLNFVIWGIAGYKRDLQKDAENRRRAAEQAKQVAASEFVGVPGKRDEFTMTLTFKRGFGSDFGVRYMQKFTDLDGNVLVWWGTNDVAASTVVGNLYTFKATVKEHAVYEGVKQTVITRAALLQGELQKEDA